MPQVPNVSVEEPVSPVQPPAKVIEDAPKTIEVDLGGSTLTVTQGTVPSGLFPLPRFLRRLVP